MSTAEEIQIESAYESCRRIARTQAKNFYYAFVALPKAKRDAICAVYAFMRRADDISDDESMSKAERRTSLGQWTAAWHAAEAGGTTHDPTFIALRDAKRRFGISAELLDQLVEGTAMDLDGSGSHGAGVDTYAQFEDLYRYCYLVASVVGLVCIRIFGYQDTSAEKLAEETGVAFQLTNILRDVREDAERGRIYLPVEDLYECRVTMGQLKAAKKASDVTPEVRCLLRLQAQRAKDYYSSAEKLLPLIAADSRPALWVLVSIYRRLLERIESRQFDVFSARIQVSTGEKISILGAGLARVMYARVRGEA